MRLDDLRQADWVVYRRGQSGRDIFEQTFVAAGLVIVSIALGRRG